MGRVFNDIYKKTQEVTKPLLKFIDDDSNDDFE